jgi:hypothetical protein
MGFLDDYEPVATRLARFWAEHPDGRVITDLVHYLADTAVFKAEIWLGDVLVATGWEEEIRGSSNVNKTSHLANAETSAIGRALANLGYAGSDPSKRPSREEMAKVERSKAAHPSAGMSGGMTEAQERAIRAMSKAMGKLPPIMEGWSKAQASACIDQLKAEQQADPAEEPF